MFCPSCIEIIKLVTCEQCGEWVYTTIMTHIIRLCIGAGIGRAFWLEIDEESEDEDESGDDSESESGYYACYNCMGIHNDHEDE